MLKKTSKWKKNKINLKAAVLAAFVFNSISWAIPRSIYAAIINPDGANTLCDLEGILSSVIIVTASLAAIALFTMLVLGGIKFLTSGGDPKGTQEAKATLTYAIAGFALLIIAWFILLFIEIFTGVQVTSFQLFNC